MTTVYDDLAEIKAQLAVLPVPETFGVSFLAVKRGVSPSYLRARPWLMPAFGVSEVEGKLLWGLPTIREWMGQTLVDLQKTWDAMEPSAKKAITNKQGVKAGR